MKLSKEQLWKDLSLPAVRVCGNCIHNSSGHCRELTTEPTFCKGRYTQSKKGNIYKDDVIRWTKSIEPMLEDRWEWNGIK